MLLYLSNYLSQFDASFSVFDYITIRAVFGALTALIISFLIGPKMIKKLNMSQLNQPVRDDGPESHLVKAGTPTMGGAMILLSVSISTLLWSDINNPYIWIILFVTISFGMVGYVDDYKKIIITKDIDNIKNLIYIDSIDWQEYFIKASIGMPADDLFVPMDGHFGKGANKLIANLIYQKMIGRGAILAN